MKPDACNNNKKAAVLGAGNGKACKGRGMAVITAAAFATAFIGVVLFWDGKGGGNETVKAKAGMVKIDLSDVSDGKAHYFRYVNGFGREIRFFVLQSKDGVLRAAFDACDVCWPEKKGYTQQGDFMVCNNCGQRFRSDKINEQKGGCNPAPIERAINGDEVVIQAADLNAGEGYF